MLFMYMVIKESKVCENQGFFKFTKIESGMTVH